MDLLLFRRIRKKKRRPLRVQALASLRRGIADCRAGRLLTREEMWADG
jgi:predicted transcriptional regulator